VAGSPLIDGVTLARRLGEPRLRVLDMRWYPDGSSARAAYARGHVRGAAFVDLEGDLTPAGGPGRHPLPSAETFQETMRAAGVNRDSEVVVYDDASGSTAGRLLWLFRLYGHDAVALLDGGLQAFPGPLETGEHEVEPGDFVASALDTARLADFDAVLGRADTTVLLDARAAERYHGEPSPLDPQPGHIPGALSAPWQGNLGADGRFLPPAELAERFRRLGVERGSDVIAYCGSGVSACHDLLALELAGLPGGRLYVGSWSDWAARPGAPVEST
jgi:thiosulfate/3-mercaptopyruvate sulfurtransferase